MFGIKLSPRNDIFFSILERASAQAVETARLFYDMLEDYTDVQAKLQHIVEAEKAADNINHDMVRQLSKTFITPIDREDLHTLAFAIDDIVDSIESAATTMVLCKIKQPTTYARQMARNVLEATVHLNTLLPNLRSMRDGQQQYVTIHELENRGDVLWQEAFACLFEEDASPMDAIKWKEVYEEIENAMDSIERTAEIVEEVIQKNG